MPLRLNTKLKPARRQWRSRMIPREHAKLRVPLDSPESRATRSSCEAAGQLRWSLRGEAVHLRSQPCGGHFAAEDRTCSDREYVRGACFEPRGAPEALRTSRPSRHHLAI